MNSFCSTSKENYKPFICVIGFIQSNVDTGPAATVLRNNRCSIPSKGADIEIRRRQSDRHPRDIPGVHQHPDLIADDDVPIGLNRKINVLGAHRVRPSICTDTRRTTVTTQRDKLRKDTPKPSFLRSSYRPSPVQMIQLDKHPDTSQDSHSLYIPLAQTHGSGCPVPPGYSRSVPRDPTGCFPVSAASSSDMGSRHHSAQSSCSQNKQNSTAAQTQASTGLTFL